MMLDSLTATDANLDADARTWFLWFLVVFKCFISVLKIRCCSLKQSGHSAANRRGSLREFEHRREGARRRSIPPDLAQLSSERRGGTYDENSAPSSLP